MRRIEALLERILAETSREGTPIIREQIRDFYGLGAGAGIWVDIGKPYSGKKWIILSGAIEHVTGNESSIQINNKDNGLVFINSHLATEASGTYSLNLYGQNVQCRSSDILRMDGVAGVTVWVRVLEVDDLWI